MIKTKIIKIGILLIIPLVLSIFFFANYQEKVIEDRSNLTPLKSKNAEIAADTDKLIDLRKSIQTEITHLQDEERKLAELKKQGAIVKSGVWPQIRLPVVDHFLLGYRPRISLHQ